MKDELYTLNQIFRDRIFRIPDYQRGYAWGEAQLKAFWEDLVSLDAGRKHYTGLISIQAVPESKWQTWDEEKWLIKKGYAPFFIVDGQQRLTTVSIFIQSLIEIVDDCANSRNDDERGYLGDYEINTDIIQKFIKLDEPKHGIYSAYKFGYEADNPSFAYLRHRVFNQVNPPQLQETLYTLNLEVAKSFFKTNLHRLFEARGVEGLTRLYEALTQRFLFNLYELHDDFDVYVAFETMNNRGKPLSNLELLKNRLIYLTTLYPQAEVDDSTRNVSRSYINSAWGEVYNQLGRNKLAPLSDDEFLRAHWIMYFKYSRKRGDDYIDFLLNNYFSPKAILGDVDVCLDGIPKIPDDFRNDDPEDEDITVEDIEEPNEASYGRTLKEINEYTDSLKSAAPVWYATHYPADAGDLLNASEAIYIDRLNRLGMAYFRPLVMSVMLRYDKDDERRLAFFCAVERFIFVVMRMCRAQSNYRSSDFLRFAKAIYFGESDIDDLLEAFDKRQEWLFDNDGTTIKSNDFGSFIDRKFGANGKGFYAWNDLRYFLYEYEDFLKINRGQQKLGWSNFVKHEKDRVSIEHIYPQTPDDQYWVDRFSGFTEEQRRCLQGSLGNLLPLSASINSSLQNVSFPEKKDAKLGRSGYANGSYSELDVAKEEEWTPLQILHRGLKMLEFLEKRWRVRLGDRKKLVSLLHLSFLDTENQGVERALSALE